MRVPATSIISMAFGALGRHRVRSLLTMLGVIIGVAAVITMVNLGQGARAQVQAEIERMGSNILYIWPGSQRVGGSRGGAGTITTLTDDDVRAIVEECPAVKAASPQVSTGAALIYGNQNWNTRAEGVNEKFPEIRNWPVALGGFFTESDIRTAARVVVLGRTVAHNLFAGAEPVGQSVRVRNLPFQVIGVLSPKGQNQWGRDQDDTILIPYTTVQRKLLAISHIHGAIVTAASASTTSAAEQQISGLLRQRHRITEDREDDFFVRNMTDIAETAEQAQRTMTVLLTSIALVSLVVGGIGIMNIMLVSVTERTREIGLRLAVGARTAQVKLQFLIESMMLSTVGGMVGIVVGVGSSLVLAWVFNWPMVISPSAAAASVIFSGGVGIIFGYYPAHKASTLNPIDALRYE